MVLYIKASLVGKGKRLRQGTVDKCQEGLGNDGEISMEMDSWAVASVSSAHLPVNISSHAMWYNE